MASFEELVYELMESGYDRMSAIEEAAERMGISVDELNSLPYSVGEYEDDEEDEDADEDDDYDYFAEDEEY